MFSPSKLICTARVPSFDNMPFPVDYPFESKLEAVRWFGALQIADSDRNKLPTSTPNGS